MLTRRPKVSIAVLLVLSSPFGCSSSNGSPQGSGGTSSSGVGSGGRGSPGSGGGEGSGGLSGSGGSLDTGGRTGTAGTSGSGGSVGDVAPPVGSPGCGATLPAACNSTTTGPCTLDVGGKIREYFIVLPSGYDNSQPVPIVFTWHGRGGTAQSLLPTGSGRGGFSLYGVQSGLPNAMYVVPQGLDSGSDAGTDYGWPNTNGQDINFVKAMIARLEADFCVDKSRTFSDGMSYGGIMSLTIACQMPDVFRAIGSIAGSMLGSSRSCVKQPIAAWLTHGDADTVLAISGSITARDNLVANNGCDTTKTRETTVTDRQYGTVTCTVYDQCTAGNYPVVWCPVVGEGHAIPSFAAAEIAKFFAQF